ncbi:MAG: flagellar filament capping protein FliD, partial [Alphaproteobacteria bacterium]|nr:flagellar filament capping protein FliD [Alphaproteobacteria bacterium]
MANSVGQTSFETRTDMYGAKRHTVSSALSTGLDPNTYATAVGDVKRAEAKDIKDKVDLNLKTIEKLTELKKNTATVRGFTESLSNYLGANTKTPNLWKEKFPTIVDGTGKDASGLVRVTATKESDIRNFTIEVLQMAKADTFQSTNTFSSKTTGLGFSGNLVIAGVTVPITDGSSGSTNMTLDDVATAVNNISLQTKVKMELISVDGTNYRWQLTALDKSKPIDLTGTPQSILDGLLIPKNPVDGTLPRITAKDSLILKANYNGQLITREGTNVISDIILNTTIEVYAENTGLLTSKIDFDRVTLLAGFDAFVSSYNDLRKFGRDQTAYEPDKKTPKEDTYLHKSNVLRDQLRDIQNVMNTWVQGIASTDINNIQSIGLGIGKATIGAGNQITSDLSGDIFPDAAKLDQLINSDKIQQVLAVVGNKTSSSNDYFRVFAIPNFMKNSALAGVPVTVNVQKVNGTVTATMAATINGTLTTVNAEYKEGGLINGPVGSAFEGFTIACKTDKIAALVDNGAGLSSTISATQGVLSRLEKTLENYIGFQTGGIDKEIERLEKENERNTVKA